MAKINKVTGEEVASKLRFVNSYKIVDNGNGTSSIRYDIHCKGGVKKNENATQEYYDFFLRGSADVKIILENFASNAIISGASKYKAGNLPSFVRKGAVIALTDLIGISKRSVKDVENETMQKAAFNAFLLGLPKESIALISGMPITDEIMAGFQKIKESEASVQSISTVSGNEIDNTEGLND